MKLKLVLKHYTYSIKKKIKHFQKLSLLISLRLHSNEIKIPQPVFEIQAGMHSVSTPVSTQTDVSVAPMRLVRHALASGQRVPASPVLRPSPGTVHRQPSQLLLVSRSLITCLLVPQVSPLEYEHQD